MKPLMLPVTHRLTGPETLVVNVLHAAHARGHLLDYDTPERLHDGRICVTITLLQPVDVIGHEPVGPDPGRVRRGLLWAVKVLAGLAGTAALAAVGWGVWLLLEWIHAHLWLLLIGFFAASVLAGLVSATNPSHDGRG